MSSPVEHWTDGRHRAFITSALRAAFRKFPNKFIALKNAFVGRSKNKRTGRDAAHYKCASCKKFYVATDIEVDHINPVVCTTDGFINWDVYIDRLYCPVDNLQVLCKPCHKKKTANERSKQCSVVIKKETPSRTKKRTTSTPSPVLKKSVKKSARSK